MRWSDLAKVLSGVLLAIALVAGTSFIATKYLVAQFTALPPKPIFPNDQPSPKAKPASTAQAAPPATRPSPQASPSASPKPSPQKTAKQGYKARIVLSEGLNLRGEPNRDSERIGGIDYNEQVTVLEDSPDGEWQRVRVEGSGTEGWIKSGFTEKING
jgi:uncharacterized protein YgiM (DUF1202 family)